MTRAIEYQREMREAIEAKLAALPAESHLRTALPKERLDAAFASAGRQLDEAGGDGSPLVRFPPLVLWCKRHADAQLAAFEEDLQRVVRHSKRKSPSEVTAFLRLDSGQDREWCGGLFEVGAKARLLEIPGLAVELDVPLPNGRESDALVCWKGKAFCFECTVITDSDEDRQVWDRFLASQKKGGHPVLIRPGPFDQKDARSPSSYYDTVRVYDKMYDKLAEEFNLRRSQFLPDSPSLLLLSFWSPTAPLGAESPGVRWALDELFADQPRKRTITDGEPTIDISLGGWLDYTVRRAGLGLEEYTELVGQLMSAPRSLSGVLLFDQCHFTAARVNYNARTACRLSHCEMSQVEAWLGTGPYWA